MKDNNEVAARVAISRYKKWDKIWFTILKKKLHNKHIII